MSVEKKQFLGKKFTPVGQRNSENFEINFIKAFINEIVFSSIYNLTLFRIGGGADSACTHVYLSVTFLWDVVLSRLTI